ncbi:MAG: M3 family metallopeptidase [Paraprevotella sp.]|nr:M3 family metallopeptidase [Paraprevotella sp.]
MNTIIQDNNTQRKNPFFEPYNTPHDTAPFHLIKIEDFEPAIMEGIRQDEAFTQSIINNPEEPTFENTISVTAPDNLLSRVTTVFFNLLSAETCDEMDSLAQKMSPILTEHANNTMLNKKLFQRVKHVYEHHGNLSAEEQMLLNKVYDGFIRSGANLSETDKEKLRALNMELSQLTLQFSQNNLKETNNFQLHITNREDLSGLPESAIEAAALAAKEKELEGWIFTLHAPSYTPFITYADNRKLREEMYMARNTICTHDNEYNNMNIVKQIVNLRRERAQLLGFNTYADFVLTKRMAENSQNVYELLNNLLTAYMPTAQEEVQEISSLAQELEGKDFVMQPWDFTYYAHKLRMRKYNIDAEMLRPYFELEKVKQGVFGLATRLYGITFAENKDIPVYHSDVTAYDVFDRDGSFLAVLYTDFHPRSGKQSGAWMTSYKEQWISEEDGNSRPHVSLTMNFTKPTESKPALLTHGEVETFLHEFGHALHGIFSNTRFESLSGTNVYWDFVELPSQFMENYAVEREFLNTFAFHYETGEPLPEELIDRIVKSRYFNVAYACIRQISFGLLDMAYYTLSTPFNEPILQFEKDAWAKAQLLPQVEGTCMTVQFGHIMSGGYSAGYYSYKWAEVLDADAFAAFQENGIFNPETAQRFRDEILSRGGTEHPMTLYQRFRGKKPDIQALLKRNGIQHS